MRTRRRVSAFAAMRALAVCRRVAVARAALRALVLALGSAALLLPRPATAEHEVYYRYTVLGYVRDAKGSPQAGISLRLVRPRTGLAYPAVTDETGLYVIVARLGDESAGEMLELRVGDQRVPVRVRFDPADHFRERGTRIDLAGGRATEAPPAFAETLRQFLAR